MALVGMAHYFLEKAYEFYILLLVFSLSAALIWLIVGKGLVSLLRVERELSHRALGHLEPVKLNTVPQEIKPLVNEINHLFERLHAGIAREKRFVADAAHELRTPLAALKAQAQVALSEKHLEEKNQALQKLMVTLDRSIHMIQQLLIMSKIGPETYGVKEMTRINLVDVVQEVMAMLVPKADSKKIDLSFEYSENVLWIKANA
ncbi:MAG: histidine kinase dimerization/phospho-acceptor domain-containing protein, partial [Methylococcales bacterium]|nr:histidine kinase dimerization/phospho-acceptor domain-containing protein [Methylococcales bacterium]